MIQVSHLGDHLIRVTKVLAAVRQRAPRIGPTIDPIGYPLMFNLGDEPRRVSDVADRVHLDISTVSRHATALAEKDLITKVPDPDDRRAQMLVLTEAGRDLLIRLREGRNDWLTKVVQDWSDEDIATFSRLLARFADDVESHPPLADPSTHRSTAKDSA